MQEPKVQPAEQRTQVPDLSSIRLPGAGLPLDWMPMRGTHFPVLVGDDSWDWTAATLLIREVCMLGFMEELTNKPDWWTKIRDPVISQKWKDEALELKWEERVRFADFTPAMADACINELRVKADLYVKTGLLPVLDYSAGVIKSDRLMSKDDMEALRAAVDPLEQVPDEEKDWHPGSDDKVLDLVHPSLWPLHYGRTRILTDRRVGINECLNHCGVGVPIPAIPPTDETVASNHGTGISSLSRRFQWLPCDVVVDGEHARIDSYISNLHPAQHAALYPVIERFIEKSLPVWDIVYRWPEEFKTQRLTVDSVGLECGTPEACAEHYECQATNRPVNDDEPDRREYEEEEEDYPESARCKLDTAWFNETHAIKLPDAQPDRNFVRLRPSDVKTTGFFNNASRLQVIVRLANIHLTPDKPAYPGGSWHIEGQLNEHICATALYYYDSENITDSELGFRTPANAEDLSLELHYLQNDTYSIEHTLAIRPDHDTLQEIGSVRTRPGRALFFPNLFQHRVSDFELDDKSRPGHRKILALFLVDPAIPVVSTANVPPQQRHWWDSVTFRNEDIGRLPAEVTAMVMDYVDFPIGVAEAKEVREQLMAERTILQGETDGNLKRVEWSFCEH